MAWMSCGAGGGLAAPPRSCTHICSTGFQVKTGASWRPTTSITARLTGMLARLTRSWVAVGTQSVGGGTSTLLLIRRLAVDRERWMSAREFGEAWALSQLSPGIHLVALAGLIGRRAAGWRGAVAAVAGMMIPAAAITVALTAAYSVIAASPIARAALAGVAPVTGGMTIATAALLVRASARHGRAHFAIDVAVSLAFVVAAAFLGVPTLAAIGAGALIGALALGRERPTSHESSVG
ncbi:MAG: chromate transporter [Chloroflexi bacterium]|nr:MAG: chromate transporter [Chloroflexota bacterium]